MSRAWTYLLIAGLLEVVWSVGLKYSQGLTRPTASVITVIAAGPGRHGQQDDRECGRESHHPGIIRCKLADPAPGAQHPASSFQSAILPALRPSAHESFPGGAAGPARVRP